MEPEKQRKSLLIIFYGKFSLQREWRNKGLGY